MGKDKDTAKKAIMPSTTRKGTNLPSRPHFSPNAAAATSTVTPTVRKSRNILPNSPLSRMSSGTENEPSDDDMVEVGTPVSSRPFSDSGLDDLYDCNDPASSSKFTKEDAAFSKAFIEMDLDDIDKFKESMELAIGEFFYVDPASYEPFESAIYIKDKDYEFNVDTEIIKIIESDKFRGEEEEYPMEHLEKLAEYANLFGKNEVEKHYYFLKLFPFSLGGEAKTWFNSLAPKSIITKEACFYLFFNKYFPADRTHIFRTQMSDFAQDKSESLH